MGRTVKRLFGWLVAAVFGLVIGIGLFVLVPPLFNQFVAPVQANTADIARLEAEVAGLEARLAELQTEQAESVMEQDAALLEAAWPRPKPACVTPRPAWPNRAN